MAKSDEEFQEEITPVQHKPPQEALMQALADAQAGTSLARALPYECALLSTVLCHVQCSRCKQKLM
eukprot:2207374-Amphidinium_carterae.1